MACFSLIQKRWIIVSIHMLTLILLYADHNLLSPNLTQIANKFGMSEQERDAKIGGQFSLAFYLLGVPSSLLFGWISDWTKNRNSLFALVVAMSECSCLSTYFVHSFDTLLITRATSGVGFV